MRRIPRRKHCIVVVYMYLLLYIYEWFLFCQLLVGAKILEREYNLVQCRMTLSYGSQCQLGVSINNAGGTYIGKPLALDSTRCIQKKVFHLLERLVCRSEIGHQHVTLWRVFNNAELQSTFTSCTHSTRAGLKGLTTYEFIVNLTD
jgi:hypothetical protein